MATVLWIIVAILCVALCAYGIATAIAAQPTAVSRAPAHRRGASHPLVAPAVSPDAAGAGPTRLLVVSCRPG